MSYYDTKSLTITLYVFNYNSMITIEIYIIRFWSEDYFNKLLAISSEFNKILPINIAF